MSDIINGTSKEHGYRMPTEFEPQQKIYMFWPERPDVWRNGAKPAQSAYAEVAKAISQFEPVTVLVSPCQFTNCREKLPPEITVVEVTSNDAWK